MNGVYVKKVISNSGVRGNRSHRNEKRFKFKALESKHESCPLMFNNSSSSDEEVVLHDIRFLKNPSRKNPDNSLRNVKKFDSSNSNGNVYNKSSMDPFRHCDFLDLKIEDGDTLQSISIKYQCAISDIKRANNLISDQDFYGKTHLKIPVKKFSLLSEILPPSVENRTSNTYVEEYDTDVRTINIGIGSAGRSPSPQEAAAFFKRMDEDLVKIMLSTNSQKDSLEAAAVVLTSPQIQPLVKDPYNTVDCGIQWSYLIMFMILIAIVIPALIALYMYVRSPHESHHNAYSNSSSPESYSSATDLNIKAKS